MIVRIWNVHRSLLIDKDICWKIQLIEMITFSVSACHNDSIIFSDFILSYFMFSGIGDVNQSFLIHCLAHFHRPSHKHSLNQVSTPEHDDYHNQLCREFFRDLHKDHEDHTVDWIGLLTHNLQPRWSRVVSICYWHQFWHELQLQSNKDLSKTKSIERNFRLSEVSLFKIKVQYKWVNYTFNFSSMCKWNNLSRQNFRKTHINTKKSFSVRCNWNNSGKDAKKK